jgi:hypothetical protein
MARTNVGKVAFITQRSLYARRNNDYVISLILESEDLLLNPAIGMTYVEEFGEFKDLFRIVIRKFKIFYKVINEDIVVAAILFPGEK